MGGQGEVVDRLEAVGSKLGDGSDGHEERIQVWGWGWGGCGCVANQNQDVT